MPQKNNIRLEKGVLKKSSYQYRIHYSIINNNTLTKLAEHNAA